MKVPTITKDQAISAWDSMNNEGAYDASKVECEYIGEDGDNEKFSDMELYDLWTSLAEIINKYEKANRLIQGGIIDSEIIEPLYITLTSKSISPFQLSHIGFWRWLSNVAYSGKFWSFIKWRFNSDKQINWGICSPSSVVEVYFYRAWLRAHKMHDENLSDPLHYARIGGSDIWRSHILRQDFGRDREFVKAFLDTIYDENGKVMVSTQELRTELIPALRAWTSNSTFSHLSYEENLKLIDWLRTTGI